MLLLTLFLAACGSTVPTATPTRSARGPLPTPVVVPWQPPGDVIDLNNVPKIQQIGSLTLHTATVNRMEFSHNGKLLLSIDGTKNAIVWDLGTGKPIQSYTGVIFGFFSADDSVLVTTDDTAVSFFDMSHGSLIATVPGNAGGIAVADMSPDGNSLVTGGKQGDLMLWDVAKRSARVTLPNPGKSTASIKAVLYSPDQKTVAAVSASDSTVRLWKAESGDPLTTIGGFNTAQLQLLFSPDSAYFAIGVGNQVQVFNTHDYTLSFTLSESDLAAQRPMAFSPDGKMFAAGSEMDLVYVWAIPQASLIAKLPEHNKRFTALAFSPNSQILITMTANPDAGAFVWNTQSFKPDADRFPRGIIGQKANGTYTGVWSPDGRMIILADASGALTIWGLAKPS